MQEDVMRKHIDLYVNNYSITLGEDGRRAIETLYQVFLRSNPDFVATQKELFL